jgi:ABC-type transport system involved in multi-copper enzyme maturation permease subunit
MEATAAKKPVTIHRWLPYWAVFQADLHQTVRSWVYRFWVLAMVLTTVGYLLYRYGVYREAGIVQPASNVVSELLRWTLVGSVTLIVALTASSISGERGTMADSVLSRGISRYQYFLGKWHARLFSILTTYFVMGVLLLTSCLFLLHEDLDYGGCFMALVTVGAVLAAIISLGVSVSAMVNSTAVGVAALWIVIYGGGFALSQLPQTVPSPDRSLHNLTHILQGKYNATALCQLMGWSGLFSCAAAVVGLGYFARRDV